MIDRWLSLGQPAPGEIYADLVGRLTIRMRLSVIDTRKSEAKDWVLSTVRHSGITGRVLNLNSLFKGGRLGDFPDQQYLNEQVYPQYRHVMLTRKPEVDIVQTRLCGVKVAYDRFILPEKADNVGWLLVCTYGRFMASAPSSDIQLDVLDESIILHLLEGETAAKIASSLNLSPRTVEHRLERIRKQVGAKTLPQLVALLLVDGFDRRIKFRDG